jgi:hypothetical protein
MSIWQILIFFFIMRTMGAWTPSYQDHGRLEPPALLHTAPLNVVVCVFEDVNNCVEKIILKRPL